MCKAEAEYRFRDDAPYPPVTITEKNITYARYLLDNLGGRNSEMTAIAYYTYNAHKCEKTEEIAHVFQQISIVEMQHLDFFAALADKLGEPPLLWTNCGRKKIWWSPAYTDYPSDLKRILLNATESELGTIDKYRDQVKHIDDPYICTILNRIICDEELHVKIFRDLYERYIKG